MSQELPIKVLPIDETLRYIQEHGCSVARFGDGEMDIIAGNSIPYQDYDASLAAELRQILSLSSSPDFMVCLSDVFEKQERYNDFSMTFWNGHLTHYQNEYREICQADWYGSTFISRPYIDLVDKTLSKGYFQQLKQLWQGKEILIVEGETSRSGVGNDLFKGAASVERIICPSKNAYQDIDWIEKAIRHHGANKLVLLMLGPTAKVIAYHLSQEGYHLIDLGHIDSEYEWFQMGATEKVPLTHKHTAEFNYDTQVILEENKEYEDQVVCRIGQLKQEPLVSLVVPIYNVASYIKECLDSICGQVYQHLEIILVNDGSTDNSLEICEAYAQKDSRIKIVHQENAGASAARNTGIEHSSGEYLMFIDSDDVVDSRLVSELYQYLVLTDSDMSMGQYYLYDESDGNFYYYPMDDTKPFEMVSSAEAIKRQANWDIYNTANYIVIYNKLFKKKLFDSIRFPLGVRFEDEGIAHRLFLKAKKIVQVNQLLYLYRIRRNSVMTSGFDFAKVQEVQAVFNQKLADLVLAGIEIEDIRLRYANVLKDYKVMLEQAGLTDTVEYKDILFKLSLGDF